MTPNPIPPWRRLSTRLSASFALLCMAVLATGLGSQWLNVRTQADVAAATANAAQAQLEVDRLKVELLLAGSALRDSGLSGDAQEVQRLLQRYNAHGAAYKAARAALGARDLSDEAKAALATLDALEAKAQPVLQRTVSLAAGLAGEGVKVVLLESYAPLQQQTLQALEALNKQVAADSNRAVAQVFAGSRRAGLLTIAACVVLCLVVSAVAWRVIRSVTRPLAQAQALATSVAEGDLTATVANDLDDEMGQLMHSLKAMRDRLVHMLAEVQSSAISIAEASSEIAQGNADLSARTELQAARLQQTASTTQLLAGTVSENTGRAQDADGLAQGSKHASHQGQAVIEQVMGTMLDIQNASGRIAEINQVIDALAFQTNILALNAAVEAARAGEQGRGFAVVAAEVRNLAQRSATAAKEIRGLIESSRQTVDAGAERVRHASQVVGQMSSGVGQVSHLISEIAQASRQQREGFDTVNHGIGELETFTQQNAALVEQVAASAGSLRHQTQSLATLVARFRLPQGA